MIPAQKDVGDLLAQDVGARLPGAVLALEHSCGEACLRVEPPRLLELARFLKEEQAWRFTFLACVSAVDWLSRSPRFEVVHHLRSLQFNYRIALRTEVPDDTLSVPSVAPIWRAADWHEREIFDLYGVRFAGHPDLRRIMMPDTWEGHPYRRDYPLAGPEEA